MNCRRRSSGRPAAMNQPWIDFPPEWTASTRGADFARWMRTAACSSAVPSSCSTTRNRRGPVFASVLRLLPVLRLTEAGHHRRRHDQGPLREPAAPCFTGAGRGVVARAANAQQRVAGEQGINDVLGGRVSAAELHRRDSPQVHKPEPRAGHGFTLLAVEPRPFRTTRTRLAPVTNDRFGARDGALDLTVLDGLASDRGVQQFDDVALSTIWVKSARCAETSQRFSPSPRRGGHESRSRTGCGRSEAAFILPRRARVAVVHQRSRGTTRLPPSPNRRNGRRGSDRLLACRTQGSVASADSSSPGLLDRKPFERAITGNRIEPHAAFSDANERNPPRGHPLLDATDAEWLYRRAISGLVTRRTCAPSVEFSFVFGNVLTSIAGISHRMHKSLKTYASVLNCSPGQIRRYIRKGEVPSAELVRGLTGRPYWVIRDTSKDAIELLRATRRGQNVRQSSFHEPVGLPHLWQSSNGRRLVAEPLVWQPITHLQEQRDPQVQILDRIHRFALWRHGLSAENLRHPPTVMDNGLRRIAPPHGANSSGLW